MFETNEWVEADYRTALSHIEAGRYDDAELLLRSILAMNPNHAPAWSSLGYTLMKCGNAETALECYAQAAAVNPQSPDAWTSQAAILDMLGRRDEVVAVLARAADFIGDSVSLQEKLARAFIDIDRQEEAFAALEQARKLDPDSAALSAAAGYVHRKLMQLDEAASAYKLAVERRPDFADAWADLGTVLQAQHRTEEAKQVYLRALDLAPTHLLALLNLSRLLLSHGEVAEARRITDDLTARYERHPDALWLAGEQARMDRRFKEAVSFYDRALEIFPKHVDALAGSAMALEAAGWFGNAFERFRQVTEIAPHHTLAWTHLANLYTMDGQSEQSVAAWRKAVAQQPSDATFLTNLALAELDIGDAENAVAHLDEAAALVPDDFAASSRVLYGLMFDPSAGPSAVASRLESWGSELTTAIARLPLATHRKADGPLRVAYLLQDMRSHPTRAFVEPLLAAHDRDAVQCYAYTSTSGASALPPSLAAACEYWRFIGGASYKEVGEQIQRDGIQVLVEVSGHRLNHRLDVMAHRPAPIQLSWPLGTGFGTGLATVDAVMGDPHLVPANMEKLFVERVLRPFASYSCYRGDEAAPPPTPSAAEKLGSVTFGYAGRSARLNDRVVARWAEILKGVPEAKLLIDHGSLRRPGPQNYLRQRFAAHGIAPERVEAGFSTPVWDAWQKIDIALDPFPASAGATILEGLWMGVPAVSLAGALPSGRFGAAILPHVGLADWVTESEEGYVARAIAAARDLDGLASLRQTLRARLAASPLCDARGFAAALEATYRRLWQEHCSRS